MYRDPLKVKALKDRHGDEQVLVCHPSKLFFLEPGFTLPLVAKTENVFKSIERDAFFMMRYDAEENVAFQQIIPYVIIKSTDNKYLVYNRLSGSGEERLHKQISIGFGGHINPEDNKEHGLIHNGLMRELEEELDYDSTDEPKFLGFVKNHDSTLADHVGLVFELIVNHANVRETEKYEGHWYTKDQLKDHYFLFEDWAKSIIDHIYHS